MRLVESAVDNQSVEKSYIGVSELPGDFSSYPRIMNIKHRYIMTVLTYSGA